MTSEKTKTTERWVTDGSIRFAGRIFSPPELVPYDKKVVHVAYDTFTDNTIDILDGNMDIIVQCPNRPEKPTTQYGWEARATELYQSMRRPNIEVVAAALRHEGFKTATDLLVTRHLKEAA